MCTTVNIGFSRVRGDFENRVFCKSFGILYCGSINVQNPQNAKWLTAPPMNVTTHNLANMEKKQLHTYNVLLLYIIMYHSSIYVVRWLDEGQKLKDQGGDSSSLNLILLKKYYTTNTDIGLLGSSSVLLRHLYSQVTI